MELNLKYYNINFKYFFILNIFTKKLESKKLNNSVKKYKSIIIYLS